MARRRGKDLTGKPLPRIVGYGKTDNEARLDFERKWEAETGRPPLPAKAPTDAKGITLRNFVEQVYLPDARKRLRATTVGDYTSKLNNYILPLLGDLKLNNIDQDDIEKVTDLMTQKRFAPRTVHHVRSVLWAVFTRAEKKRYVSGNPVRLSDPVPGGGERYANLVLTTEQIECFSRRVVDTRWQALFLLSIQCGPRSGEALGLTWDKINWKTGAILIDRQLQRIPYSPQEIAAALLAHPHQTPRQTYQALVPVKTKAGVRHVYPSPEVFEALRMTQRVQNRDKATARHRWTDRNLVFCNEKGGYLSASWIQRTSFADILKGCEVKKSSRIMKGFRWHDLRHTSVKVMFDAGLSIEEISVALGHSKVSTTQDLYGHLDPRRKVEGAKRMAEYWKGVTARGRA